MRLRRKLHRLIVNATPGAPARDYFALFQIQPELTLDEATLEQSYHALLAQFHPDLYAGQSQMEQRMAAQLCADINSAYQTLSHEVTRAEYLLSRAGVDLEAAERQGVGGEFLMKQIMLRERLEETPSDEAAAREALHAEITTLYQSSRDGCAQSIAASDWSSAARCWQEMCFLSKLQEAARPEAR